MRPRLPLYSKVLALAFLNLCLLALALWMIVRAQFRVDSGSFLLAPAQNRIMSVAHAIALELEEAKPEEWNHVLTRYAQSQRVEFVLFDEFGTRVAGPDFPLPRQVAERIPERGSRGRGGPGERGAPPPQKGREQRGPAPPLFLTATTEPTEYWAGARIPIRRDRQENPHPGTLLMMSPALLASPLFFDPTPWLTIGVAVIVISVACWLPFIQGMTRSISQTTRAASQIAEGRFEVHVPDRRRDEIGQLSAAVNRMAERLSGFVNGQRAFLRGIAHELSNPIATIQFGLGNLERRVSEDQRAAVADIQEEVHHMSALVNELLSFSKAGIDALDIKLVPVNLAATVTRVMEREADAQVAAMISVDDKLIVQAEPEYLFRALSNVVRNAIRYAGHAGPIQITARAEQDSVYLTVADNGPGVPEESLEQVFAPFYRVDPSRSPETGGMGLGLAIVRNCVEACRGAVRCRNRQPSGLEVEIRLAAAEA